MTAVLDYLTQRARDLGAVALALIDPDKFPPERIPGLAGELAASGFDAILVGGTYVFSGSMAETVSGLKAHCSLPVIIFPGGAGMSAEVIQTADAMLFLSLYSGRRAEYLVSEQIRAGYRAKQCGLERIPVGYLLVQSDVSENIEALTGTQALPRRKADVAILTAVAAESAGARIVYLDAGSGADLPVPDSLTKAVAKTLDVPLMVGGGIRTPEGVQNIVSSGGRLVVIGGALETPETLDERVGAMVRAAHWKVAHGER